MSAQSTSGCPAALPVNVMLPDGQALIGLQPTMFDARVRNHPVPVASLEPNLTPKRILLVLDASKGVKDDAWKIQTGVAIDLVETSPRLSFALAFLNADEQALDFGTPRGALQSKLTDLASARPKSSRSGEDVYGGLLRALSVFGPPQFGDAIFVFAGDRDSSSDFEDTGRIQRAFQDHGVRLFGMILSVRATSGFYAVSNGSAIPFDPDSDALGRLAMVTGGFLSVENTKGELTTYHLTPERLEQLKGFARHYRSLIATPCRIQITADAPSKPENWTLDLTSQLKQEVPAARILFPGELLPCPASTAPAQP
jgi:hypothetical protein